MLSRHDNRWHAQNITRCTALAAIAITIPNSALHASDDQTPPTRFDTLVTSAHPDPHSRFAILQSTSILRGEELSLRLEGSIGETLSSLPGITSSFFGVGASRPIIWGLDGDRIRILVNGIGSIDASSTSADHAVAGDPLTAQTIKVLRGPANLMYGSNAVGGVVNILDGRIPSALPEKRFSGQLTRLLGSVANERGIGSNVEFALGQGKERNIVVHASGTFRDSENYGVPRAESITNSDTETKSGTAGLSYVWENGSLGLSYSRFDTNYGIPVGAHDENEMGGEDEETVRIDLVQDRFDVMKQRIQNRASDPSDADASVIDLQRSHPLGELDWTRINSTEPALLEITMADLAPPSGPDTWSHVYAAEQQFAFPYVYPCL